MRTVTAQIPDELANDLDEIAAHAGRSKSWLVREALLDYVAREREVRRITMEGLEAVRAGKVVEHEDVAHELDQWGS